LTNIWLKLLFFTATKAQDIMRLWIQYLALFILLVVTPAISWVYLRNGLDYHRKALAELKKLGPIPSYQALTLQGDSLRSSDLAEKLMVVGTLDLTASKNAPNVLNNLKELHAQFDDRTDVFFLLYVQPADTAAVRKFAISQELDEPTQVFYLPYDQTIMNPYHLPATGAITPYFSLADTKGMVRKVYDLREGSQYARLVEHLALLLPIEKKENAVLKREREK
jgi:hypothetical protein